MTSYIPSSREFVQFSFQPNGTFSALVEEALKSRSVKVATACRIRMTRSVGLGGGNIICIRDRAAGGSLGISLNFRR